MRSGAVGRSPAWREGSERFFVQSEQREGAGIEIVQQSALQERHGFFVPLGNGGVQYRLPSHAGFVGRQRKRPWFVVRIEQDQKRFVQHRLSFRVFLLDRMADEAAGRGVESLYLEVRVSNARARAMYASRGFQEIGVRRDYYEKPREDARVLMKRLTP